MFEKLTDCIPYLESEKGRELYHPDEHGGMPLPIYIEETIYSVRDENRELLEAHRLELPLRYQ